LASGTDVDGQIWANPPSIGCDEWLAAPAFLGQPAPQLGGAPVKLTLTTLPLGQDPFSFAWLKDGAALDDSSHYSGAHTNNLVVNGFGPADAGVYQLVASNAFGVATSGIARIVVHCADAGSANSLPPYSDWSTAATTIQDAIDAATVEEFVLVTNGIYSAGGRLMTDNQTNRVVVAQPLTVISINGPGTTIIQGAWDPVSINGPAAVRCAWLADGAILNGFTLQGGATTGNGGGAWCTSTNAVLVNCVLSNNTAAYWGAACAQGFLQRCIIWGNHAVNSGGGAYQSLLANCLVRSNTAVSGGGAYACTLFNCTVTGNSAWLGEGGGVYSSAATNCIIFYNTAIGPLDYSMNPNDWDQNSRYRLGFTWTASCNSYLCNTTPDPQFIDGVHLSAISPCRGAGSALYAKGTDIDGEPWSNPPSMGCDEFWASDFAGPLQVSLLAQAAPAIQKVGSFVNGRVTGNASRVAWSFGDGSVKTNSFAYAAYHTWANAGDYNVSFTAYNFDNPAGVVTNMIFHVVPPAPPVLSGARLNATNFTLNFTTQFGVSYVVEEATDLAPPQTWQPVATAFGLGSPTRITDTKATNSARFYRVRIQ
jgi:hypothetical protein